jgi:hypothetical protein
VVRGFKKNRLGANDHLLSFGGGEPEAVKLKDAAWRVDCGSQCGVPALEAKVQAVEQQVVWQAAAAAAALKARLESAAAAAGGDQKRALLQSAATVRAAIAARMALYAYLRPSLQGRHASVSALAPCADLPHPQTVLAHHTPT